MSNIVLNPKWNSNINQVENGELISGGPDGNANLATKQLAENLWFLKDKTENDLLLKADKSDVYTKTQTDGKYALKATTLLGYGISDAYTKSEIDTNYGGVKTLYDKNVQAGAGANGWTDLLITNIDKKLLRDVNIEQVSCIADLVNLTALNNRTIQVKSYYNGLNTGGGIFTLIDTTQVVDNAIVFASQDATKKWLRLDQTYLTPDMFGAKPNDASFDNTDALNKAFDKKMRIKISCL